MRGSALCPLLSFAGTFGFILAGCGASADEGIDSGAAGIWRAAVARAWVEPRTALEAPRVDREALRAVERVETAEHRAPVAPWAKRGQRRRRGSGGNGGAGTGGSGGSAPHTVSPCPTANSADMVGTWTDITPSQVNVDPKFGGFNTGVIQFVINPKDTANLYLGTHSQGVYKSVELRRHLDAHLDG